MRVETTGEDRVRFVAWLIGLCVAMVFALAVLVIAYVRGAHPFSLAVGYLGLGALGVAGAHAVWKAVGPFHTDTTVEW